MSDIVKKEEAKTSERNKHIPRMCYSCKYLEVMPLVGDLELHVCGHPESFNIKGGMNAVSPMDAPNEDCPFRVYEEKYKNNFIMRWFWRWKLRRAKRVSPNRGR